MRSRFKSKGGVQGKPGLIRPSNTGNIYRSSHNFAARSIIASLVVGGLLLIIFGLKSIFFAGKISPLIGLEVSSDPPGALISLNGKKLGTTTPGMVMLNEGFNKITLEKKVSSQKFGENKEQPNVTWLLSYYQSKEKLRPLVLVGYG